MGNSETRDIKVPLQTFTPNTEVIGEIQSMQLGNITIVRDRATGREMYLRKIVLQKKEAFDSQLVYYYTRLNNPHPSLINVIGYTSEEEKAFCSEQYKIYLYFDSILKNMETELNERIKNKDYISEIELQLLSQNLVAVLTEFQRKDIFHGDICPENIFFTDEAYKLIDPSFEAGQSGSPGISKTILYGQKALLAPEVLKLIPQQIFEIKTDKYKSDVFSLGATLLSLATLTRSEDFYDYEKGEIDYALLDSRLKQVQELYSPIFSGFLKDLLIIDEKYRPDFIQLLGKLHIEESLRFYYERTKVGNLSKIPYVKVAKTIVTPSVQILPQNITQSPSNSNRKTIF